MRRPSKKRSPKRQHELAFCADGSVVAGVDEVGRGAWAGPVVAAAVVLNPEYQLKKVRDSKLLSAGDRQVLATRIHEKATAVGIGVVALGEINLHGLSWAVKQSGLRALESLAVRPSQVLLDGHWNYFRGHYECRTIIRGDATELCIAAASVVAKVHRDGLMHDLDRQHPGYGFAENKGYGTSAHQAGLRDHGVCTAHRTRWAPIAEAMQATLDLAY